MVYKIDYCWIEESYLAENGYHLVNGGSSEKFRDWFFLRQGQVIWGVDAAKGYMRRCGSGKPLKDV